MEVDSIGIWVGNGEAAVTESANVPHPDIYHGRHYLYLQEKCQRVLGVARPSLPAWAHGLVKH
jgi:hypothetical protein